MADPALLDLLERYYDAAPRGAASVEEVGPFTLFVREGGGLPLYARPRLGHEGPWTPDDVQQVLQRQRELGVPLAVEWVQETTPALAEATATAGLTVRGHPLMVLPDDADPRAEPPGDVEVRVLVPRDDALPAVRAAVEAAFAERDELGELEAHGGDQLDDGTLRMVGAFEETATVGGGSHAPRGSVTELTGIGVLPRARGRGVGAALTASLVDDARSLGVETVFLSAGGARVAAVYERLGFQPVATACVAELRE